MTNAKTTYGTLAKRATAILGEVVDIESPELTNEAKEATNHSSSGWKEFISGGLKGLGEMKVTLNYTATGLDVLTGDWSGGTLSAYTITYINTEIFSFSALVTKIKILNADAQSPETLMAEVTFQPSGSATLT